MMENEKRHQLADDFEGRDILWYVNHPEELQKLMNGIIDDELTVGRIRTIYVRTQYGSSSIQEIADYYNLPYELIKDIKDGKIFQNITKGRG